MTVPLPGLLARLSPRERRGLLVLLGLVALLLLLPCASLLLVPLEQALVRSFGVAVDLICIGLLLFLLAAFFAPLEAMGWWAGWFGEELRPPLTLGDLARPVRPDQLICRWVVYLDGIGQASAEALPEGEEFLRQLAGRLPEDIAVVRGIMPYSVLNRPMTEGAWLATFWRWVDRLRLRQPLRWLGLIINLRNITVVAVSADCRYGPVQNRGMAQVILESLVANGYAPGSGTPLTLLGFSGGGQIAFGALPHLRRSLGASVQVISLAGVFAGNNRFLEAEQVVHLVGRRDRVERLGPLAFPGRWRCQPLSFWNRARRRGLVSRIDLGPVGHQLPGGLFDGEALLPDGRSPLEQTLELVSALLRGELVPGHAPSEVLNNYRRFRANPWHRPCLERDSQPLPHDLPRARQQWIGRLILPESAQRATTGPSEVDFEVFAAPHSGAAVVGQTLRLVWEQPQLEPLRLDVHFSDEARSSERQGGVHPRRLDGWRQVTALESLAGARPHDDVLVRLPEPVRLEPPSGPGRSGRLVVRAEPIQTTGLALALLRFMAPDPSGELWWAEVFDPRRRRFGPRRLRLRLPDTVANAEGIRPASALGLARVPLNRDGWYVSGVPDGEGAFLVQALTPRALLRFAPQQVICGRQAWPYLKRQVWSQPQQGKVSMVLLSGRPQALHDLHNLQAEWRVGERFLLVHVFGGIGGEQREQALRGGICFGHFAYGMAWLRQEPLADEPTLELQYRQVYAHNPDGVVAGAQDHWRYLADRQWGWLGTRPIADILVRFPPFTGSYRVGDEELSPLDLFERELSVMMARYRLGDGSGAAFVGVANNCAQDSNQALFNALRRLQRQVRDRDPAVLDRWRAAYPEQAARLQALLRLERDLRRALLPFARLRNDWRRERMVLGLSLGEDPVADVLRGLGSWRTALPRQASETVLRVFLRHGASLLVLRADQPGGENPRIAPVAPLTLWR
jgi:predicted Abi (CAAX) family protease